jgi:hypothetical protein
MWSFIQVSTSCVAGCAMWLWVTGAFGGEKLDNGHAAMFLTLAAGFGAAWLLQFVLNWIFYGWKGARTTSWTP